jgi:type I restriction enzyme S subunit
MSELPEGWAEASLGEVVRLRGEKATPATVPDLPFLGLEDVEAHTSRVIKYAQASDVRSAGARFSPGEILYNRLRPYLNKVVTAEVEGLASAEFLVLRPEIDIQDEFIRRRIMAQDFLAFAALLDRGDRPRVNFEQIAEFPLLLPPAAEQRRIVAKLDALLAGVARARKELDRVPILIARHKQALLAAAFSGDLTRAWREENPDTSSVAKRKRQLAQDRKRLAPTTPARRNESSGGRIPVDIGALPQCWSVETLESVTDPSRLIQYGILKPGPDQNGGVPYIKVMNIKAGEIRLEKVRRTTREIHNQYLRSEIRTGDIVISIRGTVGRIAFVPAELNGGNITQDSVRVAVLKTVDPKYIYWYLHSPAAQTYLQRNMKGVAVRGINVGDMRPMEVPLPRIDEQQEIARQLDETFAWLDAAADEQERAAKLLPKLEQAILAKAFRGELVPRDPADEPASELLERIRTQRAAAGAQPQHRKPRGSKPQRAPEEKAAMTKSRFDPDVKNQPYLARLIKKGGGEADAEALFRRADLPVADFYKQLAWEIAAGHVREAGEFLEAA